MVCGGVVRRGVRVLGAVQASRGQGQLLLMPGARGGLQAATGSPLMPDLATTIPARISLLPTLEASSATLMELALAKCIPDGRKYLSKTCPTGALGPGPPFSPFQILDASAPCALTGAA